MVSLLLAKDVRYVSPLLSSPNQTNPTQLIKKNKTGIRVCLQQRRIGRTPRQPSDAPRRLVPSRGRLGRFLRRRVERTGKTASRRGVQSRGLLRTRITPRHRTCLSLGVWPPRSLDRYVLFHACMTTFTLMPPDYHYPLPTGQVVALFIVGTCEYAVVWLGTDWDHEVEEGVRRNNQEMMYQVNGRVSEVSA